MSADEQSRFRHEARTFLNHIIGYAELLAAQADGVEIPELKSILFQLQAASTALRQPVQDYLLVVSTDIQTEDDSRQAALKEEVYSSIYDLVSHTQQGRRLALSGANRDILADIHKIHEAANSLVDLFEDYLGKEAHLAEAQASLAPPRASFVDSVRAKRSGRILIVDDNEFNRDLLARHLERQGHIVCLAADGHDAFSMLRKAPFDIILLDVMMPGMNGFQFLEAIKADEHLRETFVIIISALEEPGSIAHCLKMGAEDYFLRQFDPSILRARIDSLLEKKEFKQQKDQILERLLETQQRLAAELRDAATYVRSLLPKRMQWRHLAVDWAFLPSLSLGGDCFYYQKIDEDSLAIYLIDVSGHGIEAALLSVTIMNVLRSLTLANTNFASPSSVLATLNRSFRIEDQNNMFFTIWYGVYNSSTRQLCYASAGSPPAVLINKAGEVQELSTEGIIIGIDDNACFDEGSIAIPAGSHLYLFSDGIFEIRKKDSQLLDWPDFLGLLVEHHRECALAPACLSPIKRIINTVQGQAMKRHFDDDVSILEFAFND